MSWFDFKSAIIVIQSINIFNFSGVIFLGLCLFEREKNHIRMHSCSLSLINCRTKRKHVRLLAPHNPRFVGYKWTVTLSKHIARTAFSSLSLSLYLSLSHSIRFLAIQYMNLIKIALQNTQWMSYIVRGVCNEFKRFHLFSFHKKDEDNKRITCLFGFSINEMPF